MDHGRGPLTLESWLVSRTVDPLALLRLNLQDGR